MESTMQSARAAENISEVSAEPKTIEVVVGLLRTLFAGDDREQRETLSFLKQALTEDRPSGRKLFAQS